MGNMRVVVIGATGTIGTAIVQALTPGYQVIPVSRHGEHSVDLADAHSIVQMYRAPGRVDAVICAAGEAKFAPLAQLTDEDFAFSVRSKLLGQVNVIRLGLAQVAAGGSITVTSGILATKPSPGSGAVSRVNAGLEGFVRAAALEAPRRIRINAVSPPWVTETLQALGMPLAGGLPAATVAQAYVRSLEGNQTGAVLEPTARADQSILWTRCGAPFNTSLLCARQHAAHLQRRPARPTRVLKTACPDCDWVPRVPTLKVRR